MCGVGFVAISSVAAWLWRSLRGSRSGAVTRRTHRHSRKSHLERIIIYRRNALLGIYFGLPGIFLGALFVIFRWGIFLDHSNEVVLGMFVFLAGYAGIIAGCAYWLKAKEWNEALVIIGLLPLEILFVHFVRLVLFD
jgi:H+/Cl- antiporter ClcA